MAAFYRRTDHLLSVRSSIEVAGFRDKRTCVYPRFLSEGGQFPSREIIYGISNEERAPSPKAQLTKKCSNPDVQPV